VTLIRYKLHGWIDIDQADTTAVSCRTSWFATRRLHETEVDMTHLEQDNESNEEKRNWRCAAGLKIPSLTYIAESGV
jgi:hypothetical protein